MKEKIVTLVLDDGNKLTYRISNSKDLKIKNAVDIILYGVLFKIIFLNKEKSDTELVFYKRCKVVKVECEDTQ